MLRREVQALKTQLKKSLDSAAQSLDAHNSTSEADGQPSSSSSKPDPDADRLRKAGSAAAAESGLPSPSLPATPHSPVDSPRGDALPCNPVPLPPTPHPWPLPDIPVKLHGACGTLSGSLGIWSCELQLGNAAWLLLRFALARHACVVALCCLHLILQHIILQPCSTLS